MKQIIDVNQSPLLAAWETTQSCDPDYCLVTGQPERDPLELTSLEAEKMIREVAGLRPPVFVMAGGRPLDRKDIYSLTCYAASWRLHPILVMSASPALTRAALWKLKKAGLSRLGLGLDGAGPEIHDRVNGDGSFVRTRQAMRWAGELRLPLQIHTHIRQNSHAELERIAALLSTDRILLWSVAFPVGPQNTHNGGPLSAELTEEVFARLYRLAQLVSFKIKTVEAPHYRRFVLQQRARLNKEQVTTPGEASLEEGIPGVMPVHEGRGSLFITNAGEVYPGAYLPVSAGNVRTQPLSEIYRESELFKSLRDVSRLHGKCGRCNFKEICGGSRARALAVTGDMLTEDVTCIYEPPAGLRPQEPAAGEPARS